MCRMGIAVALLASLVAACGTGTIARSSGPDDPSTVQVVVFMRNQSASELWVRFDTAAGGGSGQTSGVTSGVAVGCQVLPAGAKVAVVTMPGMIERLPLYLASDGDADQVLWVDANAAGLLMHGEGRPEWPSVTPRCPGTAS